MSHKSHCESLSDAAKVCMDLNINLKKRIDEENSTIQQIFQDEQSNMVQNRKIWKFLHAGGIPQYYNFQAGYYKQRSKTLFAIAVWNQFDNDGSINHRCDLYTHCKNNVSRNLTHSCVR